MSALLPSEAAVAWELRAAWASRAEVSVSACGARVRGTVEHVAATDAFALVWDGRDEVHLPLALVTGVRAAHFHDGGERVEPRRREVLALPPSGQLALAVGDDGRPEWWGAAGSARDAARALSARAAARGSAGA